MLVDICHFWEDLKEANHVRILDCLLGELIAPYRLDEACRDHPLDDLVVELARALASPSERAKDFDQVVWDELIDLSQHHALKSPINLVCLLLTHNLT